MYTNSLVKMTLVGILSFVHVYLWLEYSVGNLNINGDILTLVTNSCKCQQSSIYPNFKNVSEVLRLKYMLKVM